MTASLRIIMLGTGDFALPTLEHLIETGHNVVALVTQPDRPQGRKQELIPSRIKQSAQSRGIACRAARRRERSAGGLNRIRDLKPDLLVTAAYGQILSATLLSIPRLGWNQPSRLDSAGVSWRRPGRPRHPERRNGERRHRDPNDAQDRRRWHDVDRPHSHRIRTKRPASSRSVSHSWVLRSFAGAIAGLATGNSRHLASGSIESHQSSQTTQGRRTDRLVEARSSDS